MSLKTLLYVCVFFLQKTEVFSVRKSDSGRIMLTIAYTNEIPPSAPSCLQLYNIIFKRYVSKDVLEGILYFVKTTTTTTILQLFVQNYPGEPVPEETSTQSHVS